MSRDDDADHGSGSSPIDWARRVAEPGLSGSPARAAAAAARSATSGSVVGSALPVTMTSPSRIPTPSASGVTAGPVGVMVRLAGGASAVVDLAPRQRREVRDAAAELAGVQVELLGTHAEETCDVRDHLGVEPLDPAADGLVQRVAYVEEIGPQCLGLAVRYVDQPGRDQGTQDHAVAQPSPGLLEVGDRRVGEPAGALDAGVACLAHLLDPRTRVAAPVGEHLGAQRHDESRVAGHRTGVEHAHRGAVVGRGGISHLDRVAHGVVEGDPVVPERVPDRLGDLAHHGLLDRGIVQQHDVEVAERGELGAAVSTDRDQGQARAFAGVSAVGRHRGGEQLAQPAISLQRPVASLLGERGLVELVGHGGDRTQRSVHRRRRTHSTEPPQHPVRCCGGSVDGRQPLESCLVRLARANPHDRVDRDDPDLAVTDLAGLRRPGDRADHALDVGVVDDDLEADLGDQRDVVLSTAVDLGVSLLLAVAARLGHRHAGDACGGEGLADLFPLVRLDDRCNQLHVQTPASERTRR